MLGALREFIHDETNKFAIQKTICKSAAAITTTIIIV